MRTYEETVKSILKKNIFYRDFYKDADETKKEACYKDIDGRIELTAMIFEKEEKDVRKDFNTLVDRYLAGEYSI